MHFISSRRLRIFHGIEWYAINEDIKIAFVLSYIFLNKKKIFYSFIGLDFVRLHACTPYGVIVDLETGFVFLSVYFVRDIKVDGKCGQVFFSCHRHLKIDSGRFGLLMHLT